MTFAATQARYDQQPEERRREERVNLSLSGRYALGDGREYPCTTIDISPGDIVIRAPNTKAQIGERVIAYINPIGRLEGTIARRFDGCLAIRLETNAQSRERLARKIASYVRGRRGSTTVDRSHERIDPIHRPATVSAPDAFLNVETIIQKLLHQGHALGDERKSVMAFLTKLSHEGLLRKSWQDR